MVLGLAALAVDHQGTVRFRVESNPTHVMSEARQIYGNIGYRGIAANIRELLRTPAGDEMRRC